MLKAALNALTLLHSRAATLKRMGSTATIYSPCRITPSNYFRFLRGPEYTTIAGHEFIIPVDSLKGQFTQLVEFSAIPDEGTFRITFGVLETADIAFDAVAADIQLALRALTGYSKVLVTGSFNTGFTIILVEVSSDPGLGSVTNSSLKESNVDVTDTWSKSFTVWTDLIKKGDRILDGSKNLAVDEIIEMHDLKAEVMAYRVRCD